MSVAGLKQVFAVRVNVLINAVNAHLLRVWAVAWLILSAAFVGYVPTYAQTPVPLVVPTNEIFSQTNNWMQVFAPVVAIGVGIAIALAILTFIGDEILKAFR